MFMMCMSCQSSVFVLLGLLEGHAYHSNVLRQILNIRETVSINNGAKNFYMNNKVWYYKMFE